MQSKGAYSHSDCQIFNLLVNPRKFAIEIVDEHCKDVDLVSW